MSTRIPLLYTPKVLELHAGVGNFSVPLALAGAQLTAVERNRRSAILCRRNAKTVGLEFDVVEASDHELVDRLHGFDVVLLDPPRTGARAVVEPLASTPGPPRLVYVSCDSATLARDASILVQGGYELCSIEAFDMFPQTPHVEVLAVFDRSLPAAP